jgi:hypothetical protein
MKEKIVAELTKLYGSVENALKSVVSKRVYMIAGLTYLAVQEIDTKKFLGLCAVGIAFIISETIRKKE